VTLLRNELFDLLVESFDAFNDPLRRIPLTASRSYRKHSLSRITGAGTDSALHNWCQKMNFPAASCGEYDLNGFKGIGRYS